MDLVIFTWEHFSIHLKITEHQNWHLKTTSNKWTSQKCVANKTVLQIQHLWVLWLDIGHDPENPFPGRVDPRDLLDPSVRRGWSISGKLGRWLWHAREKCCFLGEQHGTNLGIHDKIWNSPANACFFVGKSVNEMSAFTHLPCLILRVDVNNRVLWWYWQRSNSFQINMEIAGRRYKLRSEKLWWQMKEAMEQR